MKDKAGQRWSRMLTVLMTLAIALVTTVVTTQAATVTIRPDGVVTATSWTGATAANLSDVSDGTVASTTAANNLQVTLGNNAAYAGATISDATLYVRASSAGSGGPERVSFGDGTTTAANISVTRGSFSDLSISLGALTPAQVDSLNIYVTSGSAGETINVADIWVVVTYTVATPENTYGTMTSMPGPLTANLSQQTVATVPVTYVLGGATVSSYTVNLSGTVASGDVAGVYVTDGTNTWSATGSYGNGSSVVCLGSNAIPGTPLSINVTLNATADVKTVAVTLQTDSNSASSLPKGPSNALTISAPSGPSANITGCDGCHGNPPIDEASRNPSTGGFVGDHQSHFSATTAIPGVSCSTCHTSQVGFNHRNANIELATPIFGGSGSYSRTASFPQSNNPTTGTCSNINCHYNTPTPQWGRATPIACNECHALPPTPASDAHSKHYASKAAQGWTTGTTTQCLVCHPDNTVHSNVTDNTVLVNGSLGFNGSTCSSTPTGCHNGKTTPPWSSTSITCSNCHVIGGGAAGDPTTGLHATTNVMAHDNQFLNTPVEGAPGTATCTSCHSSTSPSSLHYNGTVETSATATYTWNTAKIAAGYVRGTDDCAASCHTDAGTWNRRWTGVVNTAWAYANDAASTTACGNCHGSFFTGWNIIGNTDHGNPDVDNDANAATGDNPDTLATSKVSHGECSKCHAWGHTNYTTGSKHENSTLEMNSTLGYNNANPDATCTTNCHNGQTLTMKSVSGWTDATVVGDGVACGDCHNGGVQPGLASGAHAAHGAGSAQLVAGGAACTPCHGNNGGLGFQSTLAGTHGIGNAVNWATNLTYSTAVRNDLTGTCSGTAGCHVSNATNVRWDKANLTNCNQCHQNTTDINNWGWTGTAAGNISMISSTEYTAVGHGQATINTAAANKACMDCHDLTQPHDTTATLTGGNPFRLKASFTCNSIVAGCHTVTGLLGTHDQATAGSKYTWPFAAKCVDCHDPHGDGSNLSMIHSDLADKGSAANWVRNTPDAAIETMVFTNTTGIAADSYAEGATTFDGICQECHTLTTSMKDNTITNGANHTATTGCMGCHGHDVGFKASGCNGCHGGDNATLSNKNFWPGATGTSYPDRPGEHAAHITILAAKVLNGETLTELVTDNTAKNPSLTSEQKQKRLCAYCHPFTTDPGESGHYEGASGTAPADVTAAAFNSMWSAMTGNYPTTTDAGAGYSGGNGTGGSCSGIDCHNNNTTPSTQEWYDGAASTCTMCHTPGGTGTVDPLSGLHKSTGTLTSSMPHDDAFATGGTCTSHCHTTISTPGTATHADGIAAGNALAALGLPSVNNFYTQTSTAGNGSGTCSGTGTAIAAAGCHGIDPGDAGTWARMWNDTISYANNGSTECAGCHGGFNETDWTFGMDTTAGDWTVSHNKDWNNDTVSNEIIGNHQNATANATKCNICHVYNDTPNYSWSTNHRNRKITMNSTVGYDNASYTCSNNCHTEPGPHALESSRNDTWANRGETVAGPSLSCSSCHSTITTHTDADGPGTTYPTVANPCLDCHTDHGTASRTGTSGANNVYIATTYGTVSNISFTAPDRINGTGLTVFPNGATVVVTNATNAANNGTFTVSNSTASQLTVTPAQILTEGAATTKKIGRLLPTMNKGYGSPTHNGFIQMGGMATDDAATYSTEAEMCWGCHDRVTTNSYTLSGTSVTFTSPATIAATNIGTKFLAGRWITITGSTQAANNRTFKVASVTNANTIVVTIPTGAATLTTVTNATGVTVVSPVSEWGVNESADTGNVTYDYGYLYSTNVTGTGVLTSNWTTSTYYWRSGKGRLNGTGYGAYNPFWYKQGALKSTHSANYDGLQPNNVEGTNWKAITSGANSAGYNRTESVDLVANLACSNCHDVHGTHNGVNGDNSGTTGPFLRGTWTGNQYPEDGAPQWLMANWTVDAPTSTSYGRVPRGSALNTNSGLTGVPNAGGFWIDQNSGNPTGIQTTDTLATREAKATSTAGLCDQCHGTTLNGTWTSAEISAIDQITNEGLWVSGYNGHANAVVGGAGRGANSSAESYARNIFTRTKRGSATQNYAREFTPKVNVDMGLATEDDRGYSYRSNSSGYGLFYYPRTSTTTTNAVGTNASYAFRYFVWNTAYYAATRGSAIATGTMELQVANLNSAATATNTEPATYDAQANYHTFTCAKCHNPHASRLPKLMITNCLDTNHNTWDNAYQAAGAIGAPWASTRASQWATAQNCHRLDDKAPLVTSPTTTRGLGWNKVTPWQEYTTPDTAPATNPNP